MSERLIPINPNNFSHIELLDEFQKELGVYTPIGTINNNIEDNNSFSMELVLENKKKVQDICHLKGLKDLKQCTISLTTKKKKERKIISLATTYAIDVLGMEEVFINANANDKNMLEYLMKNDYECIGDEKGSIIFLKEKS